MKQELILEQEWFETDENKRGWEGLGYNEPEGYEIEKVLEYDKYGNDTKALFVKAD